MQATVDLTNCDREPIHIPGSIQPHGAMLVCDPANLVVVYASANAPLLLGQNAGIVGAELASLIGEQAAHDVRNALAKTGGPAIAGIVMGLKLPGLGHPLDVTVHRHDGFAFVEFERCGEQVAEAELALDVTQTLVRKIGMETTMAGVAKTGARLVRGMLGYDRVMVYQFLHNGAGRVIAEAKRSDLPSYMGQHFPASDIPQQARRLYLLNTIRMIGDANYASVPLTPPLQPGQKPVDMSFAQLRSVSPIHCEYLQNMGVQASLSISVIVDGVLWGLISCHHDGIKVVPSPLRIGAELFGQYFSLQMAMAERRAQVSASTFARDRLEKIVGTLSLDGSLAVNLQTHLQDFASLLQCDGAALWTEGGWTAFGVTPPMAEVGVLTSFVTATAKDAIWHTQDLRTLLASHAYGTTVAGVLVIPLSSAPRDYLMLFRTEEAHNIEWAGQPIKKVVTTPQGERLTPRGSFTLWREEVRGRSKPWTDPDIAVAEAIRTYLRDIVLRHNEITAEERTRAEQMRRVLNGELNHRVKNIIALVKSIAMQTGAQAASVADYSTSLEGRLRALAFAHDQSLTGGSNAGLSALIEAEASLHRYGASPDRVTASGPGVKLDDRAFGVLALAVHEMMTNAAKYGSLSVPGGRLAISWTLEANGDCEILWTEAGGPVVAPPTREGFGSKLIRNTIAYDLGGAVDIGYEPAGLRAWLRIPASHVSYDTAPPAFEAPVETAASTLTGLAVLIVEDQALIAMDLEDTLMKWGVASVRTVPNVKEATEAMRQFAPDVAVLDFNLGAETSEAIADDLVDKGVPFLFSTGYGDDGMIPARFRHIPIVRKPFDGMSLAAKLSLAKASAA